MSSIICRHDFRGSFLGDIDLGARTSMGVGGLAESLYIPRNIQEFRDIYMRLHAAGCRPFILGGGFNTLFPDESFKRPIIHTEKLEARAVTCGKADDSTCASGPVSS